MTDQEFNYRTRHYASFKEEWLTELAAHRSLSLDQIAIIYDLSCLQPLANKIAKSNPTLAKHILACHQTMKSFEPSLQEKPTLFGEKPKMSKAGLEAFFKQISAVITSLGFTPPSHKS